MVAKAKSDGLRDKANAAFAEAMRLRQECEALLDKNEGDSDTYRETFEKAEKAVAEGERYKALRDAIPATPGATVEADWEPPEVHQVPPAGGLTPMAGAVSPIAIGSRGLSLARRASAPELALDDYRECLRELLRSPSRERYEAHLHANMDVLQVGIDPSGGFLVEPDRQARILTRLAERSRLLDLTFAIPTERSEVVWQRVQPASGADKSIYSSGFIGAFVAEVPGATAGEVEPTFGEVRIRVDKARAKAFISRDLVDDPSFDVLAFLEQNGAENLGLVYQKAILVGDGVVQPLGVTIDASVTDNAAATDVSGTTADTVSNSTTDLGSAPKLMTFQYDLPGQYWDAAVFVLHQATELEIRKLIDAQNRYLWAAGFADRPNELLGSPVIRSSFMAKTGTDGNIVIVWGDFANYATPRRMAITVQLDPFSKADVEQQVFYVRLRGGGAVINPDAFRLAKV